MWEIVGMCMWRLHNERVWLNRHYKFKGSQQAYSWGIIGRTTDTNKSLFSFLHHMTTNLFLFVLDNFFRSIFNINWVYWTRWFWDEKWRSLVHLRLHWQKWCYHFNLQINTKSLVHIVILGKCFAWINWICVVCESKQKY